MTHEQKQRHMAILVQKIEKLENVLRDVKDEMRTLIIDELASTPSEPIFIPRHNSDEYGKQVKTYKHK